MTEKGRKFRLFWSFFPKVCYRHVAFSFDHPLENKLPGGPEKKHQSHKTMKKILHFLKKTLVPKTFLWTRVLHFWRPRWKSFNKKATSFGTVSKHGKKSFSKSIIFSISLSQRTGRVQIPQRRRKNFNRMFSLNAENDEKRIKFLENFVLWKCCYRRVECSSDTTLQEKLCQSSTVFGQSPRTLKKKLRFLMTFFPQNVLLGTVDAVLTNTLKKFPIRAESLRSLYEYGKIQIFCTKKFHSKFSYGYAEGKF